MHAEQTLDASNNAKGLQTSPKTEEYASAKLHVLARHGFRASFVRKDEYVDN